MVSNFLFRFMLSKSNSKDLIPILPLMGVIMSESTMLIKLYFVRPDLRIAEVDIHRFNVSAINFFQLLHFLAGWVTYCNENLCHISNSNLRLEQKNAFISGDTVYKCFDYRNRNPLIIPSNQRSPDIYLDASSKTLKRLLVGKILT
jgi:hypothetical protein